MDNNFRKWMNISSKLFEEEQIDEIAPVVAALARGAAAGAAGEVVDHLMDDTQLDELTDVPEDDLADEWSEDDSVIDGEEGLGDENMKPPESRFDSPRDPTSDLLPAAVSAGSEDVSELISEIDFYQTNGNSISNKTYDVEKLLNAPPETIKRIHRLVVGD